ncbi:MAG: hypothetical protein AAGF71_12705 [Pseudomonadota bacterium]
MQVTVMDQELATIRATMGQEHSDPREVFNATQALIAKMEGERVPVPHDIREFVADLEAEIVEDFFDNLPV